MAFDIDGAPEATGTEVSESELSGLFFLLLIYRESKGNINVPLLTCVSIAGFVSGSARTCSFPSSPAVPPTKQVRLAG